MPRYYFHLSDGKQVLNNHKGIDLSGNAAAREDALVLARDLKHEAVMPGWDWSGWVVTIVDGDGHKGDEGAVAGGLKHVAFYPKRKLLRLDHLLLFHPPQLKADFGDRCLNHVAA